MSSMHTQYFRYTWHELKRHVFRVIFLSLFVGILEYIWILQEYFANMDTLSAPGFLDCLFCISLGSQIPVYSNQIQFSIPYPWLCIQIVMLYAVYPVMKKGVDKQEEQILIRSYNKNGYYFSKMMTGTCFILLCYTVFYGVFLFGSMFFSHSFFLHREWVYTCTGVPSERFNILEMILNVVVLPLLTSVCLSWIQMVVSLRISVLLSALSVFAYECVAAYIPSYLLIGNYSMVFRCRKVMAFEMQNVFSGIDPIVALGIELCLCFILFESGRKMMKNYDFI